MKPLCRLARYATLPIITFWSCELDHLIIYIMFASSGKRLFCLTSIRTCIALGGPGMLIYHHKGAEGKYNTAGTHTVCKRCNNVKRSVSDRSQITGSPGGICIICIRICVCNNVKTSIPDWSQEVSWGREANDEGSSVETVLSQSPLVSILY